MQISAALTVDDLLQAFVETELLPGTGIAPAGFWTSLEAILADFSPRNAALLARRDDLQARIDAWWRARRGKDVPIAEATFSRKGRRTRGADRHLAPGYRHADLRRPDRR